MVTSMPDVHTSRHILASAEAVKPATYQNLVDNLDTVYGIAISTHGKAGPGYIRQMQRAYKEFAPRPERDPVSWSAPTKRVQWQQTLSVSFWTATTGEYLRQRANFCKRARPVADVSPPADPFTH